MWPETVAALKDALANRPTPKKAEHAGLVFVTRCGDSWHTGTPDGPISREFSKLLNKLHINADKARKGLGFYGLRHTFATVAGKSKDQVAVNFIMGHTPGDDDMPSVYREEIDDKRLQDVVDHVRTWLFADAAAGTQPDVLPMKKAN